MGNESSRPPNPPTITNTYVLRNGRYERQNLTAQYTTPFENQNNFDGGFATSVGQMGGGSRMWRPLHPPDLKQTKLIKSPVHLKKNTISLREMQLKNFPYGSSLLLSLEFDACCPVTLEVRDIYGNNHSPSSGTIGNTYFLPISESFPHGMRQHCELILLQDVEAYVEKRRRIILGSDKRDKKDESLQDSSNCSSVNIDLSGSSGETSRAKKFSPTRSRGDLSLNISEVLAQGKCEQEVMHLSLTLVRDLTRCKQPSRILGERTELKILRKPDSSTTPADTPKNSRNAPEPARVTNVYRYEVEGQNLLIRNANDIESWDLQEVFGVKHAAHESAATGEGKLLSGKDTSTNSSGVLNETNVDLLNSTNNMGEEKKNSKNSQSPKDVSQSLKDCKNIEEANDLSALSKNNGNCWEKKSAVIWTKQVETVEDAGSDGNTECIICMSEARDTLVLPCRHMAFCSYCAGIMRYQCEKCPICRQSVTSLLQFQKEFD